MMTVPRLDTLIDIALLLFVQAVAEEGNFTRAAARLHISQQALSQRVLGWEKSHGITLFIRDTVPTRPTAACLALLRQGERALVYARRAYDDAKRAGEDCSHQITVGYSVLADSRFLATLRRRRNHGFSPIYLPSAVPEIVNRVVSHEWQAGLVVLPLTEPDLIVRRLISQPLALALPANHPLAIERRVDLEDLEDETVVLPPEAWAPAWHGDLVSRIHRAIGGGKVETIEAGLEHALDLSAAGAGLAICPASTRGRRGTLIRAFRDKSLKLETALITRRENGMAPIKAYVDEVLRRRDEYLAPRSRTVPLPKSA